MTGDALTGAGLDDPVGGLFDPLERIDDLRRRQLDVAAIDQAQRRRGIEVGIGMRVDDLAAGLAVEMDVLMEIRAVAGLAAIQLNLFD